MGRKAKIKQRRRAELEAQAELLVAVASTTRSAPLAVALALSAAHSVLDRWTKTQRDPAPFTVLNLVLHLLDQGALECAQPWLGAPALEDALDDLRDALRTVPFGEPVQWAGSICVLAGCAALAADQGDDARLSECAGAAVRLAVDLLSKRELARLFAEIPDPDPELEQDALCLDALCPCLGVPSPGVPSLDEVDFDAIPLDAFHGLAVRFGCGPGC